MDNASKAIIMAGAVLIAVLVISVGVMLFNNGSEWGRVSIENLDSNKISSYNMSWSSLSGQNISGTSTKNFIEKANQHNKSNNSEIYGDFIITYKGGCSANSIKNTAYYTIGDFTYGSNGCYNGCTITQQSAYIK